MRGCSIVFTVHSETRGGGRHERDRAPLGARAAPPARRRGSSGRRRRADALACGARAGEQVVRRQHLAAPASSSGPRVPAADAVGAPAGAGRDGDVLEVVAEDLVGRDRALERLLDVREPVELRAAVVDDADPGGEARAGAPRGDAASELAGRLGERHVVAALAERHRRLEPRGAGADDEHLRLGSLRPGNAPDASRGATPRPSTGSACTGSASRSSRR